MTTDNPLILRPHPFTVDAGIYPVRAGQTLEAMLLEASQGRDIGPTVRVEIGGYEVPRQLWAQVRPKPGIAIHATVMPAGGNGGKILRTVALVALTVFTGGMAAAGWTAFGLSAATTAALTYMVGALAINALIPPPKPGGMDSGVGGLGSQARWNALTGTSNQQNPYGVIPLVVGEGKVFPPHAAAPYSEVLGDTSYHYYMFDLGYGDLDVTDIKIGDTAIASFSEVEYEVTDTPTIYTSDVNEVAVGAALNVADEVVSVERTTDAGIDEISLNIVFPAGLFGYDDKGKLIAALANITVEFRETGSPSWTVVRTDTHDARVEGLKLTFAPQVFAAQARGKEREPFAIGVAWKVVNNASSYDVKVTRGATDWGTAGADSRVGDALWTVLRSITRTNPSTTGTTKLCMRIKATDQFNGTLQTVNCVVRQKIPVYDPDTETWSANTANFNPAWVVCWLMKGAGGAIKRGITDSRIDLDNFADFADFCTLHEFETRGVLDSRMTMRQLLDDVLAGSLGAISTRDGRYAVLFDDGNTQETMDFTPLDSRNFRGSRAFTRLPHALKVRFRNPDADWDMDEIIVLDDGYSLNGVDAHGDASSDPEPTEFETLDLRFSCDAHSAWRVGRFHFAQAKFRPNTYSWDTDVANLKVTRGDLVNVAHDVPEWGTGWGRVVSLNGTTLVLDNRIETDTSASYTVRIRRNDGSTVTATATPHSPETETFYLGSTLADVNPGDVATLGETGSETARLLITGIRPLGDLGATITAVDYSDEVAAYWSDPPATIESQITGHSYRDAPPAPNITIIVSDTVNDTPDDAGILQPEVHVYVPKTSGFLSAPRFQHYREAA